MSNANSPPFEPLRELGGRYLLWVRLRHDPTALPSLCSPRTPRHFREPSPRSAGSTHLSPTPQQATRLSGVPQPPLPTRHRATRQRRILDEDPHVVHVGLGNRLGGLRLRLRLDNRHGLRWRSNLGRPCGRRFLRTRGERHQHKGNAESHGEPPRVSWERQRIDSCLPRDCGHLGRRTQGVVCPSQLALNLPTPLGGAAKMAAVPGKTPVVSAPRRPPTTSRTGSSRRS